MISKTSGTAGCPRRNLLVSNNESRSAGCTRDEKSILTEYRRQSRLCSTAKRAASVRECNPSLR